MSDHDTGTATRELDRRQMADFVERKWSDEIVPALTDYIAVPAKSPAFDPHWLRHGFIDRVVSDAAQWAEAQPVRGLKVDGAAPRI
jgi:hypothetical protein